jgi:predicted negative regulator of RcsB-dependent stress response
MENKITTKEELEDKRARKWIAFTIVIVLLLTVLFMAGCPAYRVYDRAQTGKAEYEQAKHNRQIKVEEAKAKNEAAISEAEAMIKIAHAKNESRIIEAQGIRQADSIKAIGVAEANKIIGNSLKENKEYLHYLWVTSLDKNDKVYIPTEANIPILEIGK